MSDPALLPCPFCGGKADFERVEGPFDSWTVGCEERDADDFSIICFGYQSLTTFPTKKMAAEAWNRRLLAAAKRVP